MSADTDFVFNIVWTGSVFPYLRWFVESQIAHSGARFRFVANACPPDQITLLEDHAAAHDRVIDVMVVSTDTMITHGAALDLVRAQRDDGDWFCLIDSDIRASGPFVADFAAMLDAGAAGVTSGRGVWSTTDVVPEGHVGVNGEYFWSRDGYLFGSPHFAMYRRSALDEVFDRWDVGFGAGADLSEEVRGILAAAGHDYWLYDTGKVVNILLQEAGHELRHQEHPNLLHIGGMSHYLAPPDTASKGVVANMARVDHSTWNPARLEVAAFSAAVLMAACDGGPVPEIPDGLEPDIAGKLTMVRREILALVP